MKKGFRCPLAWVAAALLWFPRAARAELIHLGKWNGALEGAVELIRQETQAQGASSASFRNAYLAEQLTLNNSGMAIVDPRLMNVSLGGTFGLSQEWVTTDNEHLFHQGTLNGYDFFSTLLGEQATSLNGFASRNQSLLSREQAGRSDVITENRGVTLFARRLYLPSTLTFRQEKEQEESRTGNAIARREDERKIISYAAERGWDDRELNLRYEFTDLAAIVIPTLSHQSHETNLNYGLDFGSELNRHINSDARYFTRSGSTDLTTLTLNEKLLLDHTERFRSEYRYFLLNTETAGQTSTAHTMEINFHHQLYDSLITVAGGDLLLQALPGGSQQTLRNRLDFNYTKRVPAQGRLNAGLGGRLEWHKNRFDSTESFIPQETHVATEPIALPITLDNPLVVSSSLSVTKTALGAIPPGCLTPSGPPVPLVLGRDYTLLSVGNAVQIVPVGCSAAAPGLNPGDTIGVDYQFTVSPALTFSAQNYRMDISMDYRWIRPYAMHNQTTQEVIAGIDNGVLDNQMTDAVGLELRGEKHGIRASTLGELSRYTSTRLEYHRLHSTQLISFSLRSDLTVIFSMDEAIIDYNNPVHKTRTIAATTGLTYAPRPNLIVEMPCSLTQLKDSLLPSERRTKAALKLRWYLRELEIHPSLDFYGWRQGGSTTREYRALLRLKRHF
jgi:hypothetical protein